MGRYKKEHAIVDVSPIPLIPAFAKRTVITDTETGRKASGYDWKCYAESDRKAWQELEKKR